MEDQKRNPVYFECDKVLSEEQKRRITNYFQIKRKSGGGECSPVEEVSGNIYRTVFTHQRDQQSVLQRTEHVVQLTEGRLTLTVKESLEPQTSEHTSSSSSSSSSTQSVQSQQVIPPSPPPPSGEEYESHPDSFQRESLQASACSDPFHPAEKVSVESLAVDEAGNSEGHDETLLESFSSHQIRDEFSQVNSTTEEVEDRSSLRDSLDSGNRVFTTNSRPSGEEIQMDAAAQIPPEQSSGGGRVHVEIIQGTIEDQQVFRSAQEELHQNQVQDSKRIVLLGKTGSGKSSLGNVILGENLFTTSDSSISITGTCQSKTRDVNGRKITLIDTPGLFDTEKSEEDLKAEIMRCVTEFAPGIHAFLIVLKVEKYTQQEEAVISRILEYFSKDALKHTVIIFTHGDELSEGKKIEQFIRENKKLSDLVERCGGRCHVFDNRRWNNNTQQNDYRSNHFHREELLKTTDKLTEERNGECYTNKMLQAVKEEIQTEEENIRKSSPENLSAEEIRDQAKNTVWKRLLIRTAGLTTGVLMGAVFGVEALVRAVSVRLNLTINLGKEANQFIGKSVGGVSGRTALLAVGVTTAVAAAAGGVIGGGVGLVAAQEAETVQDAVTKAAKAVMEGRRRYM